MATFAPEHLAYPYVSADSVGPVSQGKRFCRSPYRFSNSELNRTIRRPVPIPDLNARMTDIREVEEELLMESILGQGNNVAMGRSSTPDPAYCFHCEHKHREKCCLYVGDNEADINQYSAWKQNLEHSPSSAQCFSRIPEAISGNSTPSWFPQFTFSHSNDHVERYRYKEHEPLPNYSPPQNDPNHQPESHQFYANCLNELHAKNQNTLDQMNPNNYFPFSDPYKSAPSSQYFNTYHVFNGPVYVQHHNQTPHYYDHYNHYHYSRYLLQQQQLQQQQYAYYNEHMQRVPAFANHHEQFHPHPQGIAAPLGAAPSSSSGLCHPLWMLFYQQKTINEGANYLKPPPPSFPTATSCSVPQPAAPRFTPFYGYDVPMAADVDQQQTQQQHLLQRLSHLNYFL